MTGAAGLAEHETPYHGPHVVLTVAEAQRCLAGVKGDDAEAQAIRGKVAAATSAHPSHLQPTK